MRLFFPGRFLEEGEGFKVVEDATSIGKISTRPLHEKLGFEIGALTRFRVIGSGELPPSRALPRTFTVYSESQIRAAHLVWYPTSVVT